MPQTIVIPTILGSFPTANANYGFVVSWLGSKPVSGNEQTISMLGSGLRGERRYLMIISDVFLLFRVSSLMRLCSPHLFVNGLPAAYYHDGAGFL
jgi:hypothetical protein